METSWKQVFACYTDRRKRRYEFILSPVDTGIEITYDALNRGVKGYDLLQRAARLAGVAGSTVSESTPSGYPPIGYAVDCYSDALAVLRHFPGNRTAMAWHTEHPDGVMILAVYHAPIDAPEHVVYGCQLDGCFELRSDSLREGNGSYPNQREACRSLAGELKNLVVILVDAFPNPTL